MRVLAIRSDPVDLAPDGGVKFQALIYIPDGGAAVTFDWSWCVQLGALTNGLSCSFTPSTLASDLAPDGGLTLTDDLGSDPTVSLAYPGTVDELSSLCVGSARADAGSDAGSDDGGQSGSSTGDGGSIRLVCSDSFSVEVILAVDAGPTLRAYRTLNVILDSQSSINTNPTIAGLTFTDLDSGATVSQGGTLVYGRPYSLTVSVPPDASDVYTQVLPNFGQSGGADGGDGGDVDAGVVTDAGLAGLDGGPALDGGFALDGGPGGFMDGGPGADGGPSADADGGRGQPSNQRLESLSLAWYAEQGTFDAATTNLQSSGLADDGGDGRDWSPLLSNLWTAPAGSGAGHAVQFILVLRDDRNGVSWLVQTYNLGDAP